MAAAAQLGSLKEEATCSICLEYFKDPVSIECGHNFCRSCITQSWEGRDKNVLCPQCSEISPRKKLRPNRQLGNMVEIAKQLHLPPVRPPELNLCEKHEEKLRLFCAEDQRMICLGCWESKEHKTHSASPIEEAAEEHKRRSNVVVVPARDFYHRSQGRSNVVDDEKLKRQRPPGSLLQHDLPELHLMNWRRV